MTTVTLSDGEKKILWALINLSRDREGSIAAREIADEIDRSPQTVRKDMRVLRDAGLVETEAGTDGGYRQTPAAYATLGLDHDDLEEGRIVPLVRGDDQLEAVTVTGIRFTVINSPRVCYSIISVVGSMKAVTVGDTVRIGPTPRTEFALSGTVELVQPVQNQLVVRVEDITAPAGDCDGEIP